MVETYSYSELLEKSRALIRKDISLADFAAYIERLIDHQTVKPKVKKAE